MFEFTLTDDHRKLLSLFGFQFVEFADREKTEDLFGMSPEELAMRLRELWASGLIEIDDMTDTYCHFKLRRKAIKIGDKYREALAA